MTQYDPFRRGSEDTATTLPPAYAVPPAPSQAPVAHAYLPAVEQVAPAERVGRGVAFSLVAIPVAAALTVAIWQAGFIASLTSFLFAAGVVWLYQRGAGTAPRAGLPAVIAVVVVGLAVCFLAVVASDLVAFYGSPEAGDLGVTRTEFVTSNLFYGPVLTSYGSDFAMFVVFAALGVFSTLRRLTRGR